MRPRLGPVFQRMGTRVSADESILPVGGSAFGVVGLERSVVVGPFVAEYLSKSVECAGVLDQSIPIVVSALMPEVPRQRSIRFTQRVAAPLTLRIVGLGDIDRNDACGVPGQHRPAVRRIRLELERKAALRVVVATDDGKAQLKEGEDQAALRNLETIPGLSVLTRGKVRDDTRQPARDAERVGVLGDDSPVADLLLRIVPAEPVRPPRGGFERRAPRDCVVVVLGVLVIVYVGVYVGLCRGPYRGLYRDPCPATRQSPGREGRLPIARNGRSGCFRRTTDARSGRNGKPSSPRYPCTI